MPKTLSIVIPAFNEELYLGATLEALAQAAQVVKARKGVAVEIIVVDNESTDGTAALAESLGARVVSETKHNVGAVRNNGARAGAGEILVFIDADTLVPVELLARITTEVNANDCIGGAVDVQYNPRRLLVRLYLALYRVLARLTGMAQGATQFCVRSEFEILGGYDESLFMGEDVDFYYRLRKHARGRAARVCYIGDIRVLPSNRRYDQWPLWRILVWTNPVLITVLRRSGSAWKGWYGTPPR